MDSTPERPVSLRVVGLIGAGQVYERKLEPGQALRIMTGAAVPDGADTVIVVEDSLVEGMDSEHPGGQSVSFTAIPKRGTNVRPRGEDVKAGDVVIDPGAVITPAGVGLLASTGNVEVMVHRRPKVAIFSTGNELVSPDTLPGPGKIRNSNSSALAAAVLQAGGDYTILPPVQDTKEAFTRAMLAAAEQHDFVILTGGAAEGDFDYTSAAVKELGRLYFNKVRMRPGKAQTLGSIGTVPVFGLPGNPAAALIGFEVLIRPALRKMQGYSQLRRPVTPARLTRDIKKSDVRRMYMRSVLERDVVSGEFVVTPADNQSSSLFSVLFKANCLLIVPENSVTEAAGTLRDCLRLDMPEDAV
jgi:molybdopterin molybdotransferase